MFLGDAEEEKKNWETALAKCRLAHSNLTKLQVQIIECGNIKPTSPAHTMILGKIKQYSNQLNQKIKDQLYIVTNHTIPDLGEPTTVEHLRKKIVADFGVNFCY